MVGVSNMGASSAFRTVGTRLTEKLPARGASFSLKRVAPLATLADDSSTHRSAAILITAYTPEPKHTYLRSSLKSRLVGLTTHITHRTRRHDTRCISPPRAAPP